MLIITVITIITIQLRLTVTVGIVAARLVARRNRTLGSACTV